MATIVHKVDGAWRRFAGAPIQVTRIESTYTAHYGDGRAEVMPCDPFPIEEILDPQQVARLVDEGLWGREDLEPRGLREAIPFHVPAGKLPVGDPRYAEAEDGSLVETFDLADNAASQEPLTPEQKLAALGLTRDDLKTLLA